MSFWSKLLTVAAPIAAAPFTGGTSLAAMGLGGAAKAALPGIIGAVGSGLAGGAQKGREAANAQAANAANFAQQENLNKFNAGMQGANLDLQQRAFGQQSQSDAYKKALAGALAMNLKDVNIDMPSRIPKFTISGGLRPSAIGEEGRAAGTELNKQAMLKLMNGEKFNALPTYQGTAAPTYKKPGLFENLAGVAGLAGNTINAAQGAAEDRGMYEKYIAAIEALTKGQQPQATPGALPPAPVPPLQQPKLLEPNM